LDPYGLHLDWKVIHAAGKMQSVEIFLNFSIMDINRNVLRKDPGNVLTEQVDRLNRFWGDDSWRQSAYSKSAQRNLFGPPAEEKTTNEVIVEAFRRRLKRIAGFGYVPNPIAMRNKQNAAVYYLFFASQKPVAERIVQDIFNKYTT
jgi:three-Cys-motif partner protein